MNILEKWEEVPWWIALALEALLLIWIFYWGLVLNPWGFSRGYG